MVHACISVIYRYPGCKAWIFERVFLSSFGGFYGLACFNVSLRSCFRLFSLCWVFFLIFSCPTFAGFDLLPGEFIEGPSFWWTPDTDTIGPGPASSDLTEGLKQSMIDFVVSHYTDDRDLVVVKPCLCNDTTYWSASGDEDARPFYPDPNSDLARYLDSIGFFARGIYAQSISHFAACLSIPPYNICDNGGCGLVHSRRYSHYIKTFKTCLPRLYITDGRTFMDVIRDFVTDIKSHWFFQFIGTFFMSGGVDSGYCVDYGIHWSGDVNNGYFDFTRYIWQHCSDELRYWFEHAVGLIFPLIFTYYSIRIFLL